MAVPGDDDVDGWAALTAQLSIAGHQTSEPLRDAGVDHINTDDLAGLAKFLGGASR